MRRGLRAALAVVAVTSALVTPALQPSPATARGPHRGGPAGTIFFEGDSLITKYDDVPGSMRQGFWSRLAQRLDERAVLDAQGGSGFVKPGSRRGDSGPDEPTRCDGTTFGDRLTPQVQGSLAAADVVVVEGGRNDFHTCGRRGRSVAVPTEVLRAAVAAYLDRIAAIRAGQDPATVYVLTPWGAHVDGYDRRRVVPIVREETLAHGFAWVDTARVLDPHRLGENTTDGIHPDAAGTRALVAAIVHGSDIVRRVHDARAGRG